jgi:hypothetical protein
MLDAALSTSTSPTQTSLNFLNSFDAFSPASTASNDFFPEPALQPD